MNKGPNGEHGHVGRKADRTNMIQRSSNPAIERTQQKSCHSWEPKRPVKGRYSMDSLRQRAMIASLKPAIAYRRFLM